MIDLLLCAAPILTMIVLMCIMHTRVKSNRAKLESMMDKRREKLNDGDEVLLYTQSSRFVEYKLHGNIDSIAGDKAVVRIEVPLSELYPMEKLSDE